VFDIAFHHATPHGVITGVHLPETPDPVPDTILAQLPPAEAALARTLGGFRQPQFVGGRIALRRACEQLGVRPAAILTDDRGAPILPPGIAGSVSHKRNLAIGMASSDAHGTVGVDIEDYEPARLGIAEHVLVPEELEAIRDLPEPRRWIALLVRFSVKESIYKALDRHVRRYVGFHEAIVHPDLQGGAEVRLALEKGEGPFRVEARFEWLHGRLLTSARVRAA
jgi:phosphopantetheine--protein transferase-like protein